MGTFAKYILILYAFIFLSHAHSLNKNHQSSRDSVSSISSWQPTHIRKLINSKEAEPLRIKTNFNPCNKSTSKQHQFNNKRKKRGLPVNPCSCSSQKKLLVRLPRELAARASSADLYPILDQSLTVLGYAAFISYFVMLIYNLVRGNGNQAQSQPMNSLMGITAGISNAMSGLTGYLSSGRKIRSLNTLQALSNEFEKENLKGNLITLKTCLKWRNCINGRKSFPSKKASLQKATATIYNLKTDSVQCLSMLQHCSSMLRQHLGWKFKK